MTRRDLLIGAACAIAAPYLPDLPAKPALDVASVIGPVTVAVPDAWQFRLGGLLSISTPKGGILASWNPARDSWEAYGEDLDRLRAAGYTVEGVLPRERPRPNIPGSPLSRDECFAALALQEDGLRALTNNPSAEDT